jgi:hypothetical protein
MGPLVIVWLKVALLSERDINAQDPTQPSEAASNMYVLVRESAISWTEYAMRVGGSYPVPTHVPSSQAGPAAYAEAVMSDSRDSATRADISMEELPLQLASVRGRGQAPGVAS